MAGLLDIAPVAEKVPFRGTTVEVYGVSAKAIVMLLSRFPELRKMMTGKAVEPDRLVDIGCDAASAIIAAGIGFPGDAEQESAAGDLSIEEMGELLTHILRVTLPNGLGPLLAKLTSALGAEGEALPRGPAMKSRSPSKG